MGTIVVSHYSALRAIRYARQVYGRLSWKTLSRVEQRRALRECVPRVRDLDLDELERCGITPQPESVSAASTVEACIDVLLEAPQKRSNNPMLHEHVLSRRLPDGSIMQVKNNIYCTSPAFTALLWSRGKALPEVLMLLMELLGSYGMPYDQAKADDNAALAENEWDYFAIDEPRPAAAAPASTPDLNQQAHYKCEPAVTLRELKAVAKWATSSSDRVFKMAVSLVQEGSASPMESIMFCSLGIPHRFGGFNCNVLPKGGILLNHRINFTGTALHMASGIPYAICDAYVPAAKACLEYNGAYHEGANARMHDGQRNNGLKGMGIEVIVVNRDQLKDVQALEAIARHLHKAAQVQFRYRVKGYRRRQLDLLNGLRAAIGLSRI